MKKSLERIMTLVSIALIFMVTLTPAFEGGKVSAADLTSTLIDEFSINPTDAYVGSTLGVKVKFSEKSQKVKPGDTFTLNFPHELQGTNRTMNLDGIATCDITPSNATCTFTDAVNNGSDVSGWFNFALTAANVSEDQEKEVITDLGTGKPVVTIKITGPTSGVEPGEYPLFYKVSQFKDNAEDIIVWNLPFNLKKDNLNHFSNDVVIKDTMGSGMTVLKETFNISTEDNNGAYKSYTLEEFNNSGLGKVDFDSNGNFVATYYTSEIGSKSYTITYETQITKEGTKQSEFINNYELDYTQNGEPKSETGSATQENLYSGGAEMTPPSPSTLRIFKYLDGDKEMPLADVTFNLFMQDGTPVDGAQGVKTGKDGNLEIPNLTTGNYYLLEVAAPDHVEFDPNLKHEFSIVTGAEVGVELDINNNSKPVEPEPELIELGDYVWFDDNNDGIQDENEKPVPGATVTLYDSEGTVLKTTTTDENGKYLFTELKPGKYEVGFVIPKELVEEGYEFTKKTEGNDSAKDSNADPVTGKTGIIDLTKNDYTWDAGIYKPTPKTTEVEVNKVWEGVLEGEVVPNITINLLANGEKIDQSIELKNGQTTHTFKDLPVVDEEGKEITYTITEDEVFGFTSKIDGFNVTNTKEEVVVPEPEPEPELIELGDYVWFDENKDGIQDPNEKPIKDVVVNLYDEKGKKIATTKTDKNGYYVFKDLKPGKYEVEFIAPKGYTFTKEKQGIDAGKDSNANPETGRTGIIDLTENDYTWDAGFVLIEEVPEVDPEVDPDEEPEVDPDEEGTTTVIVDDKPSNDKKGNKLPSTATNTFNLMTVGLGLLVIGGLTLLVFRKRENN